MIKLQTVLPVTVNEQMRGGHGSVIIEHLLTKEEMYEKGRLYARIILKPGCSIGYHTHEGEMETFFVIKGTATYNDNGTSITLEPGSVAYNPSGHSHEIVNNGDVDVELIALILFQ